MINNSKVLAPIVFSLVPIIGFASSTTEWTPELQAGWNCPSPSLFIKNSNLTISSGSGQVKIKPRLVARVAAPKVSDAGYDVTFEARFKMPNYNKKISALMGLYENALGCDKLFYNNDAVSKIDGFGFVTDASYTYEERVCYNSGWTRLGKTVLHLRFFVQMSFDQKVVDGKKVLEFGTKSTVQFPFGIMKDLLDETETIEVEELFSKIPNGLEPDLNDPFSVSLENGVASIVFKTRGGRVKKSAACAIEKTIGEKLKEQGFGFAY